MSIRRVSVDRTMLDKRLEPATTSFMDRLRSWEKLSRGIRAPGMWLLMLGILIRLITFAILAPANNDGEGHQAYIEFIASQHSIPSAATNDEAFQPPLYYLLAAPIYATTHSHKAVQSLSLIFSLLTLLFLYYLLIRKHLIGSVKGRLLAFGIPAIGMPFVINSLYESNDSLTVFMGTLLLWSVHKYWRNQSRSNLWLIGVIEGLGLLTKGTFLGFLPVLVVFIWGTTVRWQWRRATAGLAAVSAFSVLALTLGSFKYAQNLADYGNPWISNVDLQSDRAWVISQRGTVRGLGFLFNINVAKIVAQPAAVGDNLHSFPLMLYGTFWYQFIDEGSFVTNRMAPTKYLGSLIYVVALMPTAVMALGACLPTLGWFSGRRPPSASSTFTVAAVALFVTSLLLVLLLELRTDVWSFLQARYLYPSLLGPLLLFGGGVTLAQRQAWLRWLLDGSMAALGILFGVYLLAEVQAFLARL